jgi:transcription elongation factor Elf1
MEQYFLCPSCGEEISMVLDLSVHRHTFIEDCEVCCNPLEISYRVQREQVVGFEVRTLDE